MWSIPLISLLLPAVLASPAPSNAFCKVVNTLVIVAKQQAPATAFCSSYLKIPVVTSTSTSTSVTVTTSVSESTYSTTTFEAPTKVIIETVSTDSTTTTTIVTTATVSSGTVTSTTTAKVTGCSAPSTAGQKRAAPAKPTRPACLSSYSTGSVLSSACSCLSVPTSTTVVQTSTISVSTTISVLSVLASTTTTPLTTSTSTTTIIHTETEVSTMTNIVPAATQTVEAQGPFYVKSTISQANAFAQIVQGQFFTNVDYSAATVSTASAFSLNPDGRLIWNSIAATNTCGSIPQVLFSYSPCSGKITCQIVRSEQSECSLKCSLVGTPGGLTDGNESFLSSSIQNSGSNSGISWATGANTFGRPSFQPYVVSV